MKTALDIIKVVTARAPQGEQNHKLIKFKDIPNATLDKISSILHHDADDHSFQSEYHTNGWELSGHLTVEEAVLGETVSYDLTMMFVEDSPLRDRISFGEHGVVSPKRQYKVKLNISAITYPEASHEAWEEVNIHTTGEEIINLSFFEEIKTKWMSYITDRLKHRIERNA